MTKQTDIYGIDWSDCEPSPLVTAKLQLVAIRKIIEDKLDEHWNHKISDKEIISLAKYFGSVPDKKSGGNK